MGAFSPVLSPLPLSPLPRRCYATRLPARRSQELLTARFQGHWYPEEPHRGCAYRALLSTVQTLDPLLLKAAESTGQRGLLESFNRVFGDAGEVNCWVRTPRSHRHPALANATPFSASPRLGTSR